MKEHGSSFSRKILKVLKWIGIVVTTIILLSLLVILIARGINKNRSKISSLNGIQENTYTEIGGIEQFIQIRGEDTNNPLILFLHGGPANPHSYVSYYYQKDLESDYTIVNWDQRGSGKTYYANSNIEANLSLEILQDDLDELVNYIRNRFGQDKLIIMGHSWGSVLGSLYSQEHPDKVNAYIGLAQTVNMLEGETLAVGEATERARKDGNEEYIEALSTLFNKFSTTKDYEDFDFKSFINMRNLTSKYLSCDNFATALKTIWLGISSPEMSINDVKWLMKPGLELEEFLEIEKLLFQSLFFDFNIYEHSLEYKVPVYFISGDCDWITPYKLVEEYYGLIKAPNKEIILIDNAGHMTFMDNPKGFSDAVKNVLNKGE